MFTRIHYILYIILTALFTACSTDAYDTEVPEGAPIVFAPSVQEVTEATRAAEGLERDFVVCGYKMAYGEQQYVMPKYDVTYSSGVYSYDNLAYWDAKATEYRFWGYTGSKADMTASVGETQDGGSVITIKDVRLQVQLPTNYPLFSAIKRVTNIDYSPVRLEFLRPIANLCIMFYNEQPMREGRDINITHITLAPVFDAVLPKANKIWNSGTVTVTYPLAGDGKENVTVSQGMTHTERDHLAFLDVTLRKDAGDNVGNAVIAYIPSSDYEFELEDMPGVDLSSRLAAGTRASGDEGQHPDHYYPLPMGNLNPDFQLSMTLDGSPRTVIIPEQYMHWQANHSYKYIFKVTNHGEVLLSDVKIEDWTNGGSQNEEFNNW